MSDSITIPSRRAAQQLSVGCVASSSVSTPQASSSANSSVYSSSPAKTTSTPTAPLPPSSLASSPSSPASVATPSPSHRRRPSLLSPSISQQEHTVVNIGPPEGPPRLITCVKASQGFDWNQEIFLPSQSGSRTERRHPSLERRQDPVHDIIISDEEMLELLPQ